MAAAHGQAQGECRRGTLTREDFEDAVQDAPLSAWERRHCAHILATNFPGYISAVIRVKLRKRSWRRAWPPTGCLPGTVPPPPRGRMVQPAMPRARGGAAG